MPSETEEDTSHPRPRPPCGATYVLMDMDTTNLDGSWSLDQIFDADTGESSSPFLLSVSEQRLWDFSDDNSNRNTITGADFRPLESSRIPYYGDNIDLINESTRGNHDDTEKLPSPFIGLMPDDNRDGPCIIKERLTQALRHFKDLTEQHHVLAQVWVPVTKGDRYMLTTSGQPFVLDPNSNGLHQYRLISLTYMFSVDGDSDGELGLPGRVFRQKLPEWTPNVQYYSSKEFPRLAHALYYNVQGTLALPIFEPSRQSCVGVLELIMTSQKINYAPEVAKICKALEAASLKSSEILDYQSTQICNEGRQNALAEILEIITVVCETYTLPLAQTWIPCLHHSVLTDGGGLKKACSSFDGSCMGQVCMSTTEVAFYVVDARMWGFREACAEHHLQKGQGVAGKAFASHKACFCQDITEFCKTEYPLVHYARMFGLKASFAICLQSNHTGNDDYILEFFLPPNHKSHSDKQTLLESLLDTIKPYFRSLRVASAEDLDYGWISIENIRASADENDNLRSDFVAAFPLGPIRPLNGKTVNLDTFEGQVLSDELNDIDAANGDAGCCIEVQNATAVAEAKDAGKKPGRKRGKAEKTISLEVLRQYFVGSLKDAAKSLGVCPTTMKRICRQHGISRWPSRKINKVNRSLTKLKRVMESVQGGEGTFQLTSLDSPSIPDPVGSVANFNGMKQLTSPGSGPSGFRDEKRATAVNINSCEDRFLPVEAPKRSRTGSGSRDGNRGTSASQGSCQHSPYLGNQTSPQNDPVVSAFNEQLAEVIGSHEPTCQQLEEMNISASFSFPDEFLQLTEEQLGQMPIEEVGSSHDLKNLCPPAEDAFHEHATESSCTIPSCPELSAKDRLAAPAESRPPFAARPEVKTITIKATYREDIIRFRLPLDSTLIKLREEVSKRLKLELLTFDIKYLDEDHEWVLIACDSDLQECVEITRCSGGHLIRLLVGDIMANLGSSCDSSGE